MIAMVTPERAVVVALAAAHEPLEEVYADLRELKALLLAAGAQVVAEVVQKRSVPDPATFLGKGKVTELGMLVQEQGAALVAFDGDLSPAQVHHLEEQLPQGVKVLDRSAVILDIFATRARTREAKLQVELAQLSYLLPRLTRRWQHLSRQAGGIGTRGVGETQLEIDRRVIRRRLVFLGREIRRMERERRAQRAGRQRVPTVALVGYTNAGKSALFQRLTGRKTLVEDWLFSTLDPLVRRAVVGNGIAVAVTDTVGFIRKLPHQLVASFRATLMEAACADVLLHVLDASDSRVLTNFRVGEEVLESLGVDPASCLVVMNKIDLLQGEPLEVPAGRRVFPVSARTGEGLEALRQVIGEVLLERGLVEVVRFPVAESANFHRALGDTRVVGRHFTQQTLELYRLRR